MLDQLPNLNPELLDQLSKRLRKHIGQPKKKEPKFYTGKHAPITVSVSLALYEQVRGYQHGLSIYKVIPPAVIKFITARHPHKCPVKFTPTTKFAPRNREFGGSLPIAIHEELQAYAEKHGLTMAAVVRRAVYEYTKPETPETPNTPDPIATIDAWADREKFIKGI